MTAIDLRRKHMEWALLFGVWVLHGGVAFWQFISITSGIQNFPLGMSFQHLLVSLVLMTWVFLNLFLSLRCILRPDVRASWSAVLDKTPFHDGILITSALLAFLLLSLLVLKGLFGERLMQQYGGYITLLAPMIRLTIYVFLEVVAVIFFYRLRSQVANREKYFGFTWKDLIVLGVFVLMGVLISITGLGITSVYRGDWGFGVPAVPLLEWQILLACAFSIGMVLVEANRKILSTPRWDFWIAILIWLGTVVIWLSHPVVPHPSALEPRLPNFEVYPFMDARVYDIYAQSALVGNGFEGNGFVAGRIPPRPLYVAFLTMLHALVGQDYNNIIASQTLGFALLPVALYFLGKEFFGRPVGIAIALLVVLRDYMSNLVAPFTGNLSYSKVYLSEIPTAILLIISTLTAMRWIRMGYPAFAAWVIGGILGAGLLIRTQVAIVLPVITLFGLLVQPKKFGQLLRSMVVMLLSIILVVSPWLWRNWKLTGHVTIDSPAYQTINLAQRYSRINNLELGGQIEPGESEADYVARLKMLVFEAITSNPSGALRGIASYFLNHAINNILLFPLRNDLKDFIELRTPTNSFWEDWAGKPTTSQLWLIVLYAFLLGLGIAKAWKRIGWSGLLPLGLNLAYNLWTSIALLSGERFMLAMDWSIILYYMIGLFTLISGFMYALKSGRAAISRWYDANPFVATQPVVLRNWRHYVLTGLLFFVIGFSLPLSEMVFSKRYPLFTRDQITKRVSTIGVEQSGLDVACLQWTLYDGSIKIVQGRALYPRFYAAGDGESFTDAVGFKAVDEGRLTFELVGQENTRIIIPMDTSPDFFPNASDVTLIIDKEDNVLFVLVDQDGVEKFYASSHFVPPTCE